MTLTASICIVITFTWELEYVYDELKLLMNISWGVSFQPWSVIFRWARHGSIIIGCSEWVTDGVKNHIEVLTLLVVGPTKDVL